MKFEKLLSARIFYVVLWLLLGGSLFAHNLDMQLDYLIFDKPTSDLMKARSAAGEPLFQAGDTVGIILKATPNVGTKTGAGGTATFFPPVGTQIVGAEYGNMANGGVFQVLAMKGQSELVHGNGPVSPQSNPGLRGLVLGPSITGITTQVIGSDNFDWGTLAGVYGDTGIFYSTDPRTAWQSWAASGGLDKNPATNDNVLQNNRGKYVTPTSVWDAHQLLAFGLKKDSIIDRDNRGATAWGMGASVAGPESGYAWAFNKNYYDANPSDPNRLKNSIEVGPWKRIRYPGSEASKDTPGRRGTTLDRVGVSAADWGVEINPSNPLPETTSWTDTTSPKAIRFSWGALELNRAEYARIHLKIVKGPGEPGAPFDGNGYLQLFGEAFGGDAGTLNGNRDHLWRYYQPSTIGLSSTPLLEKVASTKIVLPGQLFSFEVRMTNFGNTLLTNVLVEDAMPAGLTYVSATPAPSSSGGGTYRWNYASLPAQSVRTITINARANGNGIFTNTVSARSDQRPQPVYASDSIVAAGIALLYGDITVNPSVSNAGGTVQYRIEVRNEGPCPPVLPHTVRHFLPEGFRFDRVVDMHVNGGRVTSSVISVNNTNPRNPIFTVRRGVEFGKTIEILFDAVIDNNQAPGKYYSSLVVDYDGKAAATGQIAPVEVGGGKLGDLVYMDWNGNGSHDVGEPGISGVTMQLWTDPNGDGDHSDGTMLRTTTTNSSGIYNFAGVTPGNYVVRVGGGVPSGYVLTGDPQGAVDGRGGISVTGFEEAFWMDFGYRPAGSRSISGTVFGDEVNDGVYEPQPDEPISGVAVRLYFDANGDGLLGAEDLLAATTTTGTGGTYQFSSLADGLSYLVQVEPEQTVLDTFFAPNPHTPSTPSVLAVANLSSDVTGRNFGFFENVPASIGERVFIDTNLNGIFDAGDIPLPHVTLRLYRGSWGSTTPNMSGFEAEMRTDARGLYRFTGLGAGTYAVVIDSDDPNIPVGVATSPDFRMGVVVPSQQLNTANFALNRILQLNVFPAGAARAGDRLTYRLVPNFPRSVPVSNALVKNLLPPGTTLVADSISGSGFFDAGSVQWALGATRGSIETTYVPVVICNNVIRLEEPATIQDTYINRQSTSSNYHTESTFRSRPRWNRQRYPLLKFDISAIPSGASIQEATMGVRVSSTRNNQLLTAYPMTSEWVSDQVRWNDSDGSGPLDWTGGSFNSGDYNSSLALGSFSPRPSGYKTMSSSNLRNTVQNWLDNPAANRGVVLIAAGSDDGDARMDSVESGPFTTPYLEIQYQVSGDDGCTVDSLGAAIWGRTGTNNPQFSRWNGASFGTKQSAPSVSAVYHVITGASSTQRDEKILVGITDTSSNNVRAQRWDGSSWSNLPISPLGTVSERDWAGCAVEYEQLTGRAILVWNDNSQPNGWKLRYSIWDGSSWTLPTSITAYTGAEPRHMKIAAKPDSDEMVLVITDSSRNDRAIVWNGSSWGNAVTLDTSGSNSESQSHIAVAYESLTGRAMVLYGKQSDEDVYYRFWSGLSWTGEQRVSAPSGPDRVRWIVADGDPGSNRIIMGALGNNRRIWNNVWSGSSWGTSVTVEKRAVVNNGYSVAVAFESQSGNALVAYSEEKADLVRFRQWTPTAGWSPEGSSITLPSETVVLGLDSDLNTNQIMLSVNTEDEELIMTRWTGSGWKGVAELDDVTIDETRHPMAFLWDVHERNPNPPTTTSFATAGPATLINDGQQITVQLRVTASRNIDAISVPDPELQLLSGDLATAVKVSGPDLASVPVGQGGVTFTWTYLIDGDVEPSEIIFKWDQFTSGIATFPAVESNSILVVPELSFQVDIDNPATESIITNVATIDLGGWEVPSNTVVTPLAEAVGGRVFGDYNLDGVPDIDEPGLVGVRVYVDFNSNGEWDAGEPEGETNSEGWYVIPVIGAGTHEIRVDLNTVPEDFIPSTPTVLVRTLTPGGSSLDCDYGLAPRPEEGGIHGLVWLDNAMDGAVGEFEPRLPGVVVRLLEDVNSNGVLDGNDYLIEVTVTDAAGYYQFQPILSGDYLVVVDESTTPSGAVRVAGINPRAVSLAADETVADVNFGYNYNGSVAGMVYFDHNANGVRDPAGEDGVLGTADDESGVPEAVVVLVQDLNHNGIADNDELIVSITETNAAGEYLFSYLPPGNYIAKADEGTIVAPLGSPFANLVGYMLPTTSEAQPLMLNPSEARGGIEFGFVETAIVDGSVFHDEDGVGLRDPHEQGIPGVLVNISGTDLLGNAVNRNALSGPDGEFRFLISPGNYTISYDPEDLAIPDDLIRTTTATSHFVSLRPASEQESLDFGLDHGGAISGTIFADANGSGAQDIGEEGIPNVTIELRSEDGAEMVFSTVTNELGGYRFAGLPEGNFLVRVITVSLPQGYSDSPTAAPPGAVGAEAVVEVVGSFESDEQDFGFRHPLVATFSLSGSVFDDNGDGGGVEGNGLREGTEPGIGMAQLRVDVDANGDGIRDEFFVTMTDGAGDFAVGGVIEGADVTLTVLRSTLPRRTYAPTADPQGPVDGSAFYPALSASLAGQIFGFQQQPSAISGTVVLGDGNGIADPSELPMEGVVIQFVYAGDDDILGTDDDSTGSTVSDELGFYRFEDLEPGVYQVTQVVPYGYKPRADADGGLPTNITVNAAAGVEVTDRDFENYELPQIRGQVLVDADRDGIFSEDDEPIEGVTVRLFTDVNANGIKDPEDVEINTTTTNALGVYRFGPIIDPASFFIEHDLPGTMIHITDADGPTNGVNHIAVAVVETDVNERDFLNRPIPMSLGGKVFDDHNSNALQDGGETWLGGVAVRLFDATTDNQVGAQVLTNATGDYLFGNLWPGSYYVQVTPPATHPATGGTPVALDNGQLGDNNGQQSGGPGTVITSPVIALEVNTESVVDDGNPNTDLTVWFGLFTGMTISDLVWHDSNNNGIKDGSESGISGVSVRLFTPGADNTFGGTGVNEDVQMATTTTNGSGLYSFKVYTPGTYYVRITPPWNRQLASTLSVGADNGVNNDSNGLQLGAAGNDIVSPVITLTPGSEPGSGGSTNVEDTIDFGLRACPSITVFPSTLPSGNVYLAYNQAFFAFGGVAPHTWRVQSGSLPNGLTLSSGGALSGTILASPGTYWFRIEGRDSQGCVGTRDYNLVVTCPNPVVTPAAGSLTDAWHWQSYSQTFTATGGASSYTWSRSSGSFPSGLSLNSTTGVLSGTVTGNPGTYNFTIRASDPMGYCVTDRAYTLVVQALWDFGDLSDTAIATGFSGGPIADYRTRLVNNGPRHSIRPGFHLGLLIDDEAEGLTSQDADGDDLDGVDDEDGLSMPTQIVAGTTSTAMVTVTNTIGVTARVSIWIDWNGDGNLTNDGERIANGTTVSGSRNFNVNVPIGAAIGRPLGVRVRLGSSTASNSTGAVMDGEVEDYLVTVVCPTLSMTPLALTNTYYYGSPMSQNLSVSGGTSPYSWSLAAGALPPGVTLAANGVLSGTPNAVGAYTFTAQAADAYGCLVTREYTMNVKGMSVGNLVFSDLNDNGVLDAGEPGVSGALVQAFRSSDDQQVGTEITTGANGLYQLDHLPVGQIYLRVTPPAVLTLTGGTPVNSDNDVDNDNNGNQPGGPGTPLFSPVITLTPGGEPLDGDGDPDTNLTIDFGLWTGVGVGSLVWADINENGLVDAVEPGIANVRLELWRDADGDASNGAEEFVAFTHSNATGRYAFLGYPSGRYQVIVPDSNFEPGGPLYGAPFASPVRSFNDDQVDDDSNAIQYLGGGREARSPLIVLAAGTEPTGNGSGGPGGEFGRGGDLDLPPGFVDANADMTLDMGFVAPGEMGIGNLVFLDENDNGRYDPGEGLSGVTVQLFAAGDDPLNDPPLLSTMTDVDGRYLFSIVWEGSFFAFLPPNQFGQNGALRSLTSIPGWVPGDDDVGEDSLTEYAPWANGIRTRTFSTALGSMPTSATGETGFDSSSDDAVDANVDLTIDIGLFRAVGVGNLVFYDTNENGVADLGEGVDGVKVELYTAEQIPEFDTPVRTTVTAGGGLYLFDLLKRGLYKAHIPASEFAEGKPLYQAVSIGEGLSGDDDVGEDGIDSADPSLTGITTRLASLFPGSAPTTEDLETGINGDSDAMMDASTDLTVDFGFQNPVGIGNLVFIDFDGNGVYTQGEGVAGVRVELFRADDEPGEGPPLFTQTTGADGHYFFNSLGSGSYRVHIPPSQFQPGGPLNGVVPLPYSPGGDDDIGQDGLFTETPDIEGVKTDIVTLVIDESPTNDTGESGFRHTDDDFDDNNFNLTIDFGFEPPALSGVGVGNLVFIDVNGNGRYDDGEGAAAVTVQLFAAGANPQSAQPLESVLTDAGGCYIFRNLDEGDYFIHIPASQFQTGAVLAGLFSLPSQGGDDGIDDDLDENGADSVSPWTTGISSAVFNLTAGTEPTDGFGEVGKATFMDNLADANYDLTIDFGFYQSMGIGNLVFVDANGDGVANAGEGVAGVRVELYDAFSIPGWNPPLTHTITDHLGRYRFDGLFPDSYVVHIPASEFQDGGPLHNHVSLPGVQEGDDIAGEKGIDDPEPEAFGISSGVVYLVPGQCPVGSQESGLFGTEDDDTDANVDLTIDFGFAQRVIVGNLVFADLNGDGQFDPVSEFGIDNVMVELWRDGSATEPEAVTFTSDGGLYQFSVTAGTYYVKIPASEFQSSSPLAYFQVASNSGEPGDDDAGHNAMMVSQPSLDGVRTASFVLAAATLPTEDTGETGHHSWTDDEFDADGDLTIDLAFSPVPLGVGNLVFLDLDENGVFSQGDAGVADVPMMLFRVGDDPAFDLPVAETTTSANGAYLLNTFDEGNYFVHIPPQAFAVGGPLEGAMSVPGFGDSVGDDDVDENGIDSDEPQLTGINSTTFQLAYGAQPVSDPNQNGAETGFDANSDLMFDDLTDLTIDFGFTGVSPMGMMAGAPSGDDENLVGSLETPVVSNTYLAWQSSFAGDAISDPNSDADGDGLTHLVEYALGLNPLSGLGQRPALSLETNSTTGLIDAVFVHPSAGREDVRYRLEMRPSMTSGDWILVPLNPSVQTHADGTESLRYSSVSGLAQFAGSETGFVRLRIELDTDGNGVAEAEGLSPVEGWLRRSFAPGQQTLGLPLLMPSVFAGRVAAVGESMLTLSIEGTPGLESVLTSGTSYFVEVSDGAQAGHRFEINETGSTGASLSLDLGAASNTTSSLSSTLIGAQIRVRPHWTLRGMLPPQKLMSASSSAQADRALLFDPVSNEFIAYWNQAAETATWTAESGGAGSDAGQLLFRPGQGMLVHIRQTPVTLTWTGTVRDHAFRLPLVSGTQMVSGGYPTQLTPAKMAFQVSNGFTSGLALEQADRFTLWLGDTQPGATGYQTYFLQEDATQVQLGRWVDPSDPTFQDLSDQISLPVGRASFLKVLAPQGIPAFLQSPPNP